jgi:hypothetical protein
VFSDRGGEANVSEIQRQLISKFCTLALTLEIQEAQALAGKEIDLDLFGRCAGHMRRIAETLGTDRVARAIPSLQEYLAALKASTPIIEEPPIDVDETSSESTS